MVIPRWSSPILALVFALVAAACGGAFDEPPTALSTPTSTTVGSPSASATTASATSEPATNRSDTDGSTADTTSSTTATTAASVAPTTEPVGTVTSSAETNAGPIPIRLRIDRRVSDAATEGFAATVEQVLTDERGWTNAGFEFTFTDAGGGADYTVVLAEGTEVDSLCLPYDTYGQFSCQIGPVVALNADRWRTAVDRWPASLDDYRTMLINHEIGHLLGQHHPAVRCPGDGQPAPVMAQQSSGVAPCAANPWPLPWEITCARQGVEPLAPPFERDITLTCGPGGPIG